ncbi:B3 domain-containing transcription factor ABI3 isoform X2 [Rhododendron vialii]|uniref:B3 domain-containing transcription factor ABI3 isoform X2 n=1 Tax=Rhododendron vialii TaxID=182163 RepID=UPI00265E0583|nr:B3 domain-containing transcription factor ABI3 isoform X2 [Rhododendron vialii]
MRREGEKVSARGAGGGGGGIGGDEIWLEGNAEEDLLVDVNDPSIFYSDFPPLPDFPCMSSSSSSSSAPAPPPKPIASSASSSSSSSAASWALLKSDAEESYADKNRDQPVAVAPPLPVPGPPEDGIDCMDVMETFGYMELMDSNEIWDPSSIFQADNPQPPHEESLLHHQQQQQYHHNDNYLLQNEVVQEQQKAPAPVPVDELGTVFFEWLKSNKEYISAEDMRNIKLRRATVESASKRLGSTKEGRKQLLKLILEWVENYQLQKKQAAAAAASSSQFPFQEPFQNPNPNCNPIPSPDNINPCFPPSTWLHPAPPPQPQYVADPTGFPYGGDLYTGGGPSNYQTEYQTLETAQTWPPSSGPQQQYPMGAAQIQFNQFPEANTNSNVVTGIPNQQGFVGYGGNPYQYQHQYSYQGNNNNGEKLVRLGSLATKEARKKRMARQKRFLSHHRHHQLHQHHNHNQQNQQLQMISQKVDHNQQVISIGGCESRSAAGQVNPGANWVYWPNANAAGCSSVPVVVPAEAPPPPPQVVADCPPPVQGQNSQQRQVHTEKRQGWKPEKNLKFLLQKVLKQSDVGNLGRIVLPKKEAETHLPELEARDGIAITMEDIGTSQVWNMRYRFWPNNKSRMYLLENTGDFVRANGLQEGDFIVIYSDVKCAKYMIRGVKVRQPGPKSEAKKPAKSHRRSCTAAQADGSGSSSQPSRRA